MTNINTRDGQRHVTLTLAKLHGIRLDVKKLKKLQMQAAVIAMLNSWRVEQLKNGDLRMRRGR